MNRVGRLTAVSVISGLFLSAGSWFMAPEKTSYRELGDLGICAVVDANLFTKTEHGFPLAYSEQTENSCIGISRSFDEIAFVKNSVFWAIGVFALALGVTTLRRSHV